MNNTRRKFVSNRYKANATCPCGKDNKNGRFATEKGFEGQYVGHCHDCVKDFWNDDTTLVPLSRVDRQQKINYCLFNWDDVQNTFDENLESNFAKYLCSLFGEEVAISIIERYYLGLWGKDVIFWQIDRKGNVRHGEIIEYNSSGNRQKQSSYRHEIKRKCQLQQCLFGDHLLANYDLPIAVVEAPKTASIMSQILPSFIWLATSSAGNLKKKSDTILGRDVTLFPDQGKYEKWGEIAKEKGFEISKDCEFWFKDGLIAEKDDIADYYLKNHSQHFGPIKVDPHWDQDEYDSIFG